MAVEKSSTCLEAIGPPEMEAEFADDPTVQKLEAEQRAADHPEAIESRKDKPAAPLRRLTHTEKPETLHDIDYKLKIISRRLAADAKGHPLNGAPLEPDPVPWGPSLDVELDPLTGKQRADVPQFGHGD